MERSFSARTTVLFRSGCRYPVKLSLRFFSFFFSSFFFSFFFLSLLFLKRVELFCFLRRHASVSFGSLLILEINFGGQVQETAGPLGRKEDWPLFRVKLFWLLCFALLSFFLPFFSSFFFFLFLPSFFSPPPPFAVPLFSPLLFVSTQFGLIALPSFFKSYFGSVVVFENGAFKEKNTVSKRNCSHFFFWVGGGGGSRRHVGIFLFFTLREAFFMPF